jgi:hypothetical protein
MSANHTTQKRCLVRILKSDREKLERLIFQRYPAKEWGSFFRFGFRRTSWGLAASFVSTEPSKPGDLDRQSALTVFRSRYILRAHHIVEDSDLAAGVIHSHPQGFYTFPSPSDDDMDEYYGKELERYGKGQPYMSIIFARDRDGNFYFTGRVYDDGVWYPVTDLLTVSDELEHDYCQAQTPSFDLAADGDTGEGVSDDGESFTARLEVLLGKAATKRLSRSTVGVLGCSGTGSPAVHVLARAGVGRFILVDPQRLSHSNVERVHGSRFEDFLLPDPPTKVESLARLIKEINPDAEVICIRGNVLDESVLDALLECDLLLGCADSQHCRAALGDLASHYLLPSLEVSVAMRAKEGKLKLQLVEVCYNAPQYPCAFCLGRIDQKALAYELMTDEERKWRKEAAKEALAKGLDGSQYWGGEPPQELTVGYLTSLAGSMAAGYVQNLLTGSAQLPHQRFQFDVGWEKLGVAPVIGKRSADCSCGKTTGHGDQARADRSVSQPPHWPPPELIPL